MSNEFAWYLARAGGWLTWGLVSASVIWGLLLSTRLLGRNPKPAWMLDLHRFLGGLAVVFLGIHVGTLLLDAKSGMALSQVLLPFTSAWRPVAVALGVVSLYLLLAVEITSLLRQKLPRRVWHRIHLASLPLFVFSTAHTLMAGTDAKSTAARWVLIGTSGVVGGLVGARLVSETGRARSGAVTA